MVQKKMKKILMLIAWLATVGFNQQVFCAAKEYDLTKAMEAKGKALADDQEQIEKTRKELKEPATGRHLRQAAAAQAGEEQQEEEEPVVIGLSLEELFGDFIKATDRGPEDHVGKRTKPLDPTFPKRLHLMKRIDYFINVLLYGNIDAQQYEASIKHLNEEYERLKQITQEKITVLELGHQRLEDKADRRTKEDKALFKNILSLLKENRLFQKTLDEIMKGTYEQLNLSSYSQEYEQIKGQIATGAKILKENFSLAGERLQQAKKTAADIVVQFPVLKQEIVYRISDAVQKARKTFSSLKKQGQNWLQGLIFGRKPTPQAATEAEEVPEEEEEGGFYVEPKAEERRDKAPIPSDVRAEMQAALNAPPGGEGELLDLPAEENAGLAQQKREAEERLQQQEAEAAKEAEQARIEANVEAYRASLPGPKDELVESAKGVPMAPRGASRRDLYTKKQAENERAKEIARREEEQAKSAMIIEKFKDVLLDYRKRSSDTDDLILNALLWHAMRPEDSPLTTQAQKDLIKIFGPQNSQEWKRWQKLAIGSGTTAALAGIYKYTPEEYRKAAALGTAATAVGALAASHYLNRLSRNQKKYESDPGYQAFLQPMIESNYSPLAIFVTLTSDLKFQKLAIAWDRLQKMNVLIGNLFSSDLFQEKQWARTLRWNLKNLEKRIKIAKNDEQTGGEILICVLKDPNVTDTKLKKCGFTPSWGIGSNFKEKDYRENLQGDVYAWLVSKSNSEANSATEKDFFSAIDHTPIETIIRASEASAEKQAVEASDVAPAAAE